MTEATGTSPSPAPRPAPGPRAVAVVVRAGRLLVIKRHFAGRDYAVLPGGSVESGETFEQAAVRELREETSMSARVDHLLLTAEHDGREARYFVMADEHLRTDLPRLLALR